jgi:hypothetical protein
MLLDIADGKFPDYQLQGQLPMRDDCRSSSFAIYIIFLRGRLDVALMWGTIEHHGAEELERTGSLYGGSV